MRQFASVVGRYAGTEVRFEAADVPARGTWYSNAVYDRGEPKRRGPFVEAA